MSSASLTGLNYPTALNTSLSALSTPLLNSVAFVKGACWSSGPFTFRKITRPVAPPPHAAPPMPSNPNMQISQRVCSCLNCWQSFIGIVAAEAYQKRSLALSSPPGCLELPTSSKAVTACTVSLAVCRRQAHASSKDLQTVHSLATKT